MEKEEILRRIDKMRETKKWTLSKLECEAGLSAGMIYRWYGTQRTPTINSLESLCHAMGYTLGDFFAEEESMESGMKEKQMINIMAELTDAEKDFLLIHAREYMRIKKETNGRSGEE